MYSRPKPQRPERPSSGTMSAPSRFSRSVLKPTSMDAVRSLTPTVPLSPDAQRYGVVSKVHPDFFSWATATLPLRAVSTNTSATCMTHERMIPNRVFGCHENAHILTRPAMRRWSCEGWGMDFVYQQTLRFGPLFASEHSSSFRGKQQLTA